MLICRFFYRIFLAGKKYCPVCVVHQTNGDSFIFFMPTITSIRVKTSSER